MNYLIVCNTPYQVFNAINILVNDVEIVHSNCDVLIDETFNAFVDAKKIGMRLIEYEVCRSVYYTKEKKCMLMQSKMETFLYLKKNDHTEEYTFSDTKLLNIHYDAILVGDTNHIGSSFIYRNSNCEVIWYDDGLSSYAKSPRNFGNKLTLDIIMRILRLASYSYKPQKLYVNNVSLAKTKEFALVQLPGFDENNRAKNIEKKIFGYFDERSEVKNYDYVYLGQLLETIEGYTGIPVRNFIHEMKKNGVHPIIRKHPRERVNFEGYKIDDGTNMWELECLEGVSNGHVLIACCSTAQLTPKMIGGKEPYLIFLYKILIKNESSRYKAYEEIVDDVINMYSQKCKIFVPNNMDEFSQSIKKIKEEKEKSK